MMITIGRDPIEVIKHYNIKIVTYTTYDQILIHNETTGEIDITTDGMSGFSYDECIEDVRELFKEQMGLNEDGKKI